MKTPLKLISVAALLATITACDAHLEKTGESRLRNSDYDESFVEKTTSDPNALYDFLADNTVLFQFETRYVASQLRYFNPDQTMVVWFSEEDKMDFGQWQIRQSPAGELSLCFTYASDYAAYRSIIWNKDMFECYDAGRILETAVERVSGNPLQLEAEASAYNLRTAYYDMKDYASFRGVPNFTLNYLDVPYNE